MKSVLRVVALLLLLAVLLGLGNAPHDMISAGIGRLYPTVSTQWLRWPSLLLHAYLVEAVTCLPLAWLLALVYRRAAWVAALLLTIPFAWRLLVTELPYSPNPPFGPALYCFHLIAHVAFLPFAAFMLSAPRDATRPAGEGMRLADSPG